MHPKQDADQIKRDADAARASSSETGTRSLETADVLGEFSNTGVFASDAICVDLVNITSLMGITGRGLLNAVGHPR